MKRILLVIFALISLNAFSQLQVKEGSFKYVPGGVIEDKEEYTDGNDLPMALIKISTENINEQERPRLVLTGNRATQIIKKPKTGEMWVYISAESATFINIKHPDYGTFKYPLPEGLCDYCVYEMVLQYIPLVQETGVVQQNNYLTIIADQPNASIYIDDEYVSDGFKSLAIGTTHTWKIECDMYHAESGSVTITKGEPITIEKQLRPAYGFINVTSKPESGAVVFIDNKKVGTTPYQSDKMASGTYKVRVVKDMYKTTEQTFTITDENTTNAVLEMSANFVNLNIETDAASDIYIDGQYKGKGKWSGRIADGAHFLEVKKDKHKTVSKNLNLVLGKDENLKIEAPTPITGFLDISSIPVKADIYLNGKHYGTTPRIIPDLLIGDYTLKLEKEGCASVTKNITIEENQTLTIRENLPVDKEAVKTTQVNGKKDIAVADKTKPEKMVKEIPNINFITLNVAYSVAPQTSFGFTYGQVKRFGWFVSAMSNFGFRLSANDWNDLYSTDGVVNFSGKSSKARLSVTGGFVVRLFGPIYAKLGAGYGARVKCWEVAGKWYEYTPDTYKGFDLTAGIMLNTRKYAISADVVTNNFKTMEVKLGVGLNWNK